jgi:hypothetical protein
MMNWQGFGRKRSLPNFKVLSQDSSGRTEESHESVGWDSRDLKNLGTTRL